MSHSANVDHDHHPEIRRPFPMSPLLIVVIGILLVLLFISGGFNIWVISNPDHPFRQAEVARAKEDMIRQQQIMVQQGEERARAMQMEFQQKLGTLQRKNDELVAQVEALKEQVEDAKRK